MLLELVHNEACDLNTVIKNLTSNPAKILGIRNGTLSWWSEADIAIFDLEKPWVLKKENIQSKSKNTAIENRKLQGKVEKTFINGRLVFQNNGFFIVIIYSYLLGSIPFGLIFSKSLGYGDIEK